CVWRAPRAGSRELSWCGRYEGLCYEGSASQTHGRPGCTLIRGYSHELLLESPGMPGAFFCSLCIGEHRTRRQAMRWSVGHDRPSVHNHRVPTGRGGCLHDPTDHGTVGEQQICLFAKQSATYKGRELPRAPRADPYVQLSRIRFPPWVSTAAICCRMRASIFDTLMRH